MRIAALHFPELRLEVVTDPPPGPLAIVVQPAPMTELKLLGNTKLDVVSVEARRLGIRTGMTIAQARARASHLSVRVVRPESVRDVLARLAEIALAFGATVSFDTVHDVVWVDITGCAHLHGSEDILAARLAGVMGGQGHACTVAVADGPRIASIFARVSPEPVFVVPPGKNGAALGPLPVQVLPIEDPRWLIKLGVKTIADLRALPRASLAPRLGATAHVIMGLADGDDRAPLTAHVPPEVPEEEAQLEYGIEGTEALVFVAKTLTDRLAARLAGRAVAAARIELDLMLDPGMIAEGDERLDRISLALPAPLSAAGDLLAALRPKIERLVLRAPVLVAKLRAPELVHKPQAVLSLLEPQPKADRALPRLVAELAADLGELAVGKLSLGDAWTPEDRSRFVRLSSQLPLMAKRRPRHLVSSVPEPTRLLAIPQPIPRENVKIVRHLSRVEHVEWWRRLPGEGPKRGFDYVYAWTEDGAAWVELDRASNASRIRGWFD